MSGNFIPGIPKPVTRKVDMGIASGVAPEDSKPSKEEVEAAEEEEKKPPIMPSDIKVEYLGPGRDLPVLSDLRGKLSPQDLIDAGKDYEAARDDHATVLFDLELAEEFMEDAMARERIDITGGNDKSREALVRSKCAREIAAVTALKRRKIITASRLEKAEKRIRLYRILTEAGWIDTTGAA